MVPKNAIHRMLEHRWRIGQPERENPPSKFTKACVERRLWDVFVLQFELMVTSSQVKRAEILSAAQIIHEIIYAWHWEFILDRDFVETPVIDTHARGTIGFGYEKNRSTICEAGLLNPPIFNSLLCLLLNFRFLFD